MDDAVGRIGAGHVGEPVNARLHPVHWVGAELEGGVEDEPHDHEEQQIGQRCAHKPFVGQRGDGGGAALV